ncbi:MAG: hypothetical protein U5K43_00840 [Halofilum sp. (in: g-proteobacteria)]|nr:hypothetical protein [Halofilum sp. (in: g-proteobacteria)]
MAQRVLQVAGIWVLVFAAAWGLLRVVDEALTVPGAHAGADALLALFVSLPLAILTATAIAIRRQVAGHGGGRGALLSGRRAVCVALVALALEGLLLLALEARPHAAAQWGVFLACCGVMLGAGGRLAELFGGLE